MHFSYSITHSLPSVDVDECEVGTAICDPNSDCVDTEGSYDCNCRAGYTGDGRLSCMGMFCLVNIYC